MMLSTLPLLLACATLASPFDLCLTGAHVLSPDGASWIEASVWIDDGEIQAVIPRDDSVDDRVALTEIDLGGAYVIPGLIDLHTHLLLHPYDETSWNDQVLKESLELRTIRATVAAQATLEAGFTTIRELGTEGAAFADVALRDAIGQAIIPGPRIYAVTRALVATGCYGPAGFDPRWDMPVGAQVADGVDGVRKAVREQVAAGADWIKVYADYRRRPGDPSTPTFSQDELDAIVDEANSARLPVAAHAVTAEAIARCVRAGVKTIEHGYEATPAVLRMMALRDVVLCPTLAASASIARYRGWQPGSSVDPRITASRQLIQNALDTGVTVACGSDSGVFRHGDNAHELELMVAYGMTPQAALASATTVAAGVLGEEGKGKIAEGYTADLVVVAADPLQDIGALRRPTMVLRNGRVAFDSQTNGAPGRPGVASDGTGTPGSPSALVQGDARTRMEFQLREAERQLQLTPGDERAIIWVGRRLAYLGRYEEAIARYTRGLEIHPGSARLFRHRGHRNVTLRRFEAALADFEHAGALIDGTEDEIEPDGMPNATGIPLSSLHFNVYYHWGLSHFLRGEFDRALEIYELCKRVSTNADLKVATSHWLVMTLIRLDRLDDARALAATIPASPDLIENRDYHRLLLFYSDRLSREEVLAGKEPGTTGFSTTGFGVASWLDATGQPEQARTLLEQIVCDQGTAAFGYIAAETELSR